MIQFNIEEQRNLSKNIKKISYQLTKEIRYLEKSIQIYISTDISIENEDSESITNFLQYQIKENMNQNILSEFFIFSKKFKLNQEIYLKKCEELVIEDDEEDKEINNTIEMKEISTTNSGNEDNVQRSNSGQNFLMKDEPDLLLQERDNEIGNIVKGVNTLHEMFKDMNILVNEQGTILDRIDYNIDMASNNVVKGKNSLIKANEYHKNNCFRNVIIVILVCIFIESLMLIFKFIN